VEHKNHICQNSSTRSIISEHRLQFGHEFDWDHVEILDEESLWKEMERD